MPTDHGSDLTVCVGTVMVTGVTKRRAGKQQTANRARQRSHQRLGRPRTWQDWAALAFIVATAFTLGGVAVKALWPTGTPLSWHDRFDLVCLVESNDMIAARKLVGLKRLDAEARAADDAKNQFWRQDVPISDLLDANTVRFDKQHLATIRHQIVDAYTGAHRVPPQLHARLHQEQESASVDAQILGLSICGNIDPTLE